MTPTAAAFDETTENGYRDETPGWLYLLKQSPTTNSASLYSSESTLLPDRGSAVENIKPPSGSFHRRISAVYSKPTQSSTTPDWLTSVERVLVSFRNLTVGWDGHGGVPTKDAAIGAALRFLAVVSDPRTPLPSIVPVSDGGVQLEWHAGQFDIEVFFPPNGGPGGAYYVQDLLGDAPPQEGGYTGKPVTELFGAIAAMASRIKQGI